ncbi:MAG TPA: hypothetical protein VF054_07055 [Micromonosporaceae bacterium]
MAGSLKRIRTRLDIWRQVVWQYRVTATGTLLAAFSVATALTKLPQPVNVVGAVVGGAVALLEIRELRGRARAVVFQPRVGDTYADIEQSEHDRGHVIRTSGNVGIVLVSESQRLRRRSPAAYLDERDYTLPDELTPWSLPFLLRQMRTSTLHNGRVVGLASDLPPTGATWDTVKLRRVTYFDFVCTNVLAGYDVHEVGLGRRLKGRELFINRHGRLRNFADSSLANVIGVSTLALTCDGKLVLPFQTEQNVGSPDLYPPSGSGALEQQDLPSAGSGLLRDIVIRGATREMCEECNIDRSEVQETQILGHARWLSRGGMPEFCAVTLLSVRSEDIESRVVVRAERPYIKMVATAYLAPVEQWNPEEPLAILPSEIAAKASWPLAFCLSCLAEAMRDRRFRLREEIGRRVAL